MRSFQAIGAKRFDVVEIGYTDPALVKLKVDLISPSITDVALFQGKLNIEYPRTPCHMATGIVSEDRDEYGLKLGTRVLINPYVQDIANRKYSLPKLYGVDKDGFLANFIEIPNENICPFPEDVKEDEAVFAHIVAVAVKALQDIEIEKGMYISIIGGSLLSLVVAQLALYYQAIPILIASDKRYLSLAEAGGVFYYIDDTKEDVVSKVFEITGGRMSDYCILHAFAGSTATYMSALTANGGECRIVNLTSIYIPRIDVNLSEFTRKNLTIKGISCGFDSFNTAIHILAQKQISFDNYIDKRVDLEDAQELFLELSKDPNMYIAPVIKA